MNLLQKTKDFIRARNFYPRRHLGQNFMVSAHFLHLLCSYAEVTKSDIVLEIGAGLGFLTRILSQSSRKVLAVEVDHRLMQSLQAELGNLNNIELIEGNVLTTKIRIPFNKVVSNPPFSISSRMLLWLLGKTFDRAVFTLQKEYAKRLIAPVGSKEYSRLTVCMLRRVEVELLDIVPQDAFYPLPEVEAQIVRFRPLKDPPFKIRDEKIYDETVRLLFTQRNRKVHTAIRNLFPRFALKHNRRARAELLPFHNKRVRELSPEDFEVLANELST